MSRERMRVVALGGCGGMGQFAVRTALPFDFVDEIVIADVNGERARDFAEQCGSKASSVEVNVEDKEALRRLVSGADVLLNMVGPYYQFGVPILRTAIEAGCHYIDINDDWEPTLDMLKLDEEARQAGITAIIGMGASPGISNLLAVKAMSLLDTIEDLVTGWGAGLTGDEDVDKPGEGGTFGAAIEHWVQQFTGKIRLLRKGKFVDVSPLEEIKLDYPGIGQVTTYTVGHPEPITLPRFKPEIQNSCNVMDFPPQIIAALQWLAEEVDSGRKTIHEASDWLESITDDWSMRMYFTKLGLRILLTSLRNVLSPKKNLNTLFALATGTRDGKQTTVGVTLSSWPTGGMEKMTMGAITGVPVALALAMFARGQIDRPGVSAPENVIDPDAFFDELALCCTPTYANARELLVISIL